MAENGSRIRILLVDGHALFREAVRATLEREDDLAVVGEAGDEFLAVAEAHRIQPDVALVDASLGRGEGLKAVHRIKREVPDCRILVLAGQEEQEALFGAVEAGASGFLTKGCALTDLISAARSIHRGDTLVPPEMLGDLLQRLISRRSEEGEINRRLQTLTRREREVLELLGDGADKHAIARSLVISPETARTHIQHILEKLGVHSQLEAAALVMKVQLSSGGTTRSV